MSWLFSSVRGSSCDADFTRFAFAIIINHTRVSRVEKANIEYRTRNVEL
jgi:hypothetical protein